MLGAVFLPVAHGDKGLREATFIILLLVLLFRRTPYLHLHCSPSSSSGSHLNISYYVVIYLSD